MKLKLYCKKHNKYWTTTSIGWFLNKSGGCRSCAYRKYEKLNKEKLISLCEKNDFKFLGWDGEWKGAKTKVRRWCQKHAKEARKISYDRVINGEFTGCSECIRDGRKEKAVERTNYFINKFKSSRFFPDNIKFQRSSRLCAGALMYWWYLCPICKAKGFGDKKGFESHQSGLNVGYIPCCCPVQYKYLYILYNQQLNYIKYGICTNFNNRLKLLERKNNTTYEPYYIFDFTERPDLCTKAESLIKSTLCSVENTGRVDKNQAPDGYTDNSNLIEEFCTKNS